MFEVNKTFSSFSVDDIALAEEFYGTTLGLQVKETEMGLELKLENNHVFIYPKPNHIPATHTILNFVVPNIDAAIETLTSKGIKFEHYDGDMQTDEKGVLRGLSAGKGPDIAWFKDPAGNFLSVLQEK